jgi:type IV pilus assembly protein PilW
MAMKMHAPLNRLAGLSLIELLVAIALGGLLMGGAISLFVNNRATYEVTNDMARLQENARFALQILTQDIRMAGYTGCLDEVSEVNDLIGESTGDLANFSFGIEGYEQGGTTGWLPTNHLGQDDPVHGQFRRHHRSLFASGPEPGRHGLQQRSHQHQSD